MIELFCGKRPIKCYTCLLRVFNLFDYESYDYDKRIGKGGEGGGVYLQDIPTSSHFGTLQIVHATIFFGTHASIFWILKRNTCLRHTQSVRGGSGGERHTELTVNE